MESFLGGFPYKSHVDIKTFRAFPTKLKIELNCIMFPLIILEELLQLNQNPPVVNSVDWTLFGKAHSCLLQSTRSHERQCMSEHEVKGNISRPLRQNCLDS